MKIIKPRTLIVKFRCEQCSNMIMKFKCEQYGNYTYSCVQRWKEMQSEMRKSAANNKKVVITDRTKMYPPLTQHPRYLHKARTLRNMHVKRVQLKYPKHSLCPHFVWTSTVSAVEQAETKHHERWEMESLIRAL